MRTHLTRSHQRYARSHVRRESLVAAGKRGAAVTRAKYGDDFLLQRLRVYRIEHPSFPELVMIGILTRLGAEYEREWRIGDSLYCADFYLPALRKAIDVHGAIHRRLEREARLIHDERKARLCAAASVDLLIIEESDFDQGEALIERVRNFLRIDHQGRA
jgi:hypothetical protein